MGWTPDDVAVFHHHRIFWNAGSAWALFDDVVEGPTPSFEEGTSTGSPEADKRGLVDQVCSGTHHGYVCYGCGLVSRSLSAESSLMLTEADNLWAKIRMRDLPRFQPFFRLLLQV